MHSIGGQVSDTTAQPKSATKDAPCNPNWWRQAAVYQIYPRSFADHNGDGLGDIKGITARVPYLKELGVDAVWLSPFYPSELADGGYDVADYRDVDPRLGSLADFDEMVSALHASGIKLIVDIVPNHTSDQHEWFQEALQSPPGSAARDRYVFRDGIGPDGSQPPTDWQSVFGGPAWHQVPDGQWYLHLFAPEQPDLNWDNKEVHEDFIKTLRFWSNRGVDGFRIDVAHALTKDLSEPLPTWEELRHLMHENLPLDGTHPFWDRDEVHEIYAEWRKVFNEYDPPRTAVAEAWVPRPRRPRYASAEGLGQAFNFDLLEAAWDASEFREVIDDNLTLSSESGASSTWVLSNHDVVRHATRYGLPQDPDTKNGKSWLMTDGKEPKLDRELGERRARAAVLLLLALPGSTYMYQGEELGLHEVGDLPEEAMQDPSYFRNKGVEKGRDGCRVPLPWTPDGASFGFGSNGAHLPQPGWFADVAVSVQENDPASTLWLYRRALEARHKLQSGEALEWVDNGNAEVLHFARPDGWQCVTNFSAQPVPLPPGEVVLASVPVDDEIPADTTVWLKV